MRNHMKSYDLTRAGITPDPNRMATERGAYYAANMHSFAADKKKQLTV